MPYLLSIGDKDTGITRSAWVPDHLAWFAAEEVLNNGHRLIAIQNTKDSEPLTIETVQQTRANKAANRKAYGRDIYEPEESWYRSELRRLRS